MRRCSLQLKKLVLAFVAAIALAAPSVAQIATNGSCLYSQALTSRQGFSNLAAVVPQATISVTPGPIYADPGLTSLISGNTITADAYGNYNFCVAPNLGAQVVNVTGPNMNTLTYYFTPGQIYSASGTWTGTNVFSGPTTFSGSVTFPNTVTFNNLIAGTVTTEEVESQNPFALTISGGATGNESLQEQGVPIVFLVGPSGNINVAIPNELETNSTFSIYDALPLYGMSFPSELAVVNLTAQVAAISTTTLYATNALTGNGGSGQYRVSWNAKVVLAATSSSTLGALTIGYTDLDGTVQSITAAAQIAAGTIATTSPGNTTATVLLGMPITLNVKASTSITYAFAYSSTGATPMQYNLHITLEAM